MLLSACIQLKIACNKHVACSIFPVGVICCCFIIFSGVKVTEVAHDYHVGVMKYVTEELGILNSYDTWHGEHYYLLYL